MAASSQSLTRRLRASFFTGLLAILPLVLTLIALAWIAGVVNGYIGPRTVLGGALRSIGYRFSPISDLWLAYFIGVWLFLALILALGLLLESGFKKSLEGILEKTIRQLPLVRAIYRTTDRFIHMVPSGDGEGLQGMRVVYCRFGSGDDAMGTLALMPTPEIFRFGDRDHHIVVIPTAPIPMGGAMLFVPADSVFETSMSIDAFAGSYISLGVATKPFDVGQNLQELARSGRNPG